MNLLGKIIRLQIQRGSLKRDDAGRRVYDPAPLLAVDALTLTRTGACAHTADGSFTLDVHNSAHPHTKFSGANPLSFGFTSHYAVMRSRFGEHLTTGCAGENILIETDVTVSLADVSSGVFIETPHGRIALESVIVARPCRPFSTYALAKTDPSTPELKAALQFLDDGTRGFYCALASTSPATVTLGDQVFSVGPSEAPSNG